MNGNCSDGESIRDKIKKYDDRYKFWQDKRISQLSFHNNLFITLGLAAMGYFWKGYSNDIILNYHSIYNYYIIFFLYYCGIALLALSLICGFILSLSRLYDIRLTAHIVLTEKRRLKAGYNITTTTTSSNYASSNDELKCKFSCNHCPLTQPQKKPYDNKSKKKYNKFIFIMMLPFIILDNLLSNLNFLRYIVINYQKLKITKIMVENCPDLVFDKEIYNIRQKSDKLGSLTWNLLIGQTVYMFVSLFILIIFLFIK